MPQLCTECGKVSIPGLVRGYGKCQYHYNVYQFGQDWADKCASGEYVLQATGRRDADGKPVVGWLPKRPE